MKRTKPTTNARIIAMLNAKYPGITVFERDDCVIMSCESGFEVNGLPLADYYAEDFMEKTYTMGVENKFNKWLEDHELWSEWDNPGCLCIYDNLA